MKILVNLFHPHLDGSRVNRAWAQRLAAQPDITVRDIHALYPDGRIDVVAEQKALLAHDRLRSEEHTSELQSPSNLVCRLLREKKKAKK